MKDFTTCSLEALQKFQENFNQQELKGLIENVDSIVQKAKATGQNPAAILKDLLSMRERELKIGQMQRLATLETNAPILAKMESHKAPLDLLEGILGIDRIKSSEGNIRVAETKDFYMEQSAKFIGKVFQEDPKVLKRLTKNDPDLLSNLGKYWDKKPHNLSPTEMKFADGIRKLYDFQYQAKRSAKIDVGYIPDYVGRTRHPPDALRDMGLEAWKESFEKHFKVEGTRAEIDEALDQMYERITNRPFDSSWTIDSQMKKIEYTSKGNRLEKSRSYEPKSMESWLAYHRETGQNYLENVISDLHQDSGEVAAAQAFGPKWRQALAMNLEAAKANMVAQGKFDEFKKRQKEILDSTDYLLYPRTNPAKNLLGHTVVGLNRFTDMVKLQMSLFSAIPDWANANGTIGAVTGRNILENFADTFGNYAKNMAPRGISNVNQVAQEVGFYAQDFLYSLSFDRYGEAAGGFHVEKGGKFERLKGGLNAMYKGWMEATLLGRTDFSLKRAQSASVLRDMARGLDHSFKDLPPASQKTLARVGITEADWGILKHAVTETPNAGKIVPIESIQALPDEMFNGKTTSERMRAREQLALKVYNHVKNNVDISVASLDVKSKARNASLDPNDYRGAAMTLMMKYKSFPIAVLKTMQYNYQVGGLKTLIPTMGAAIVLSGMAYTARKIAEGTAPEDIKFDNEAKLRILVSSGIGGIYTDLLFSDRPFAEGVLGPSFGVMGDAVHLAHQTKNELIGEEVRSRQGLRSDYDKELQRVTKRNIPAFPYTRAILNKAISEYFQEVAQ